MDRDYGITIEYFDKGKYFPYKVNMKTELDPDITAGEALICFYNILKNFCGYEGIDYEIFNDIYKELKEEEN